jgi:hypothetical protein
MKHMLWVGLLVVMAAGAAWAQFYDRLGAEERRNLAEAYYLVGRQYAEQGERAKGSDFEGMAYNIYPGLDPAAIASQAEPSAPQLILAGKAVAREDPEAVAVLLKSRFLRLVSAFLTEDTPTLLAMMDGSVWFTRFAGELEREAIRDDLEAFFTRVDLSGGLPPSVVYDLESLEVNAIEAAAPSWGSTYAVRIRARADFSGEVAFWEQEQQYLFHRRDGQWLLFAVGSGLPPGSWAPRPAASPVAAAAAGHVDELKAIREAFLASLEHFLAKQTDEASRYFSREILILRLNATLTREEMAATFEGYFEGSDFSGVAAGDVVDTGSISVEPSERFAVQQPGPVYLLSVRTRLDLSDKIPFWTRFQEYYFSPEEGDWRIFAIF